MAKMGVLALQFSFFSCTKRPLPTIPYPLSLYVFNKKIKYTIGIYFFQQKVHYCSSVQNLKLTFWLRISRLEINETMKNHFTIYIRDQVSDC